MDNCEQRLVFLVVNRDYYWRVLTDQVDQRSKHYRSALDLEDGWKIISFQMASLAVNDERETAITVLLERPRRKAKDDAPDKKD